MKNLLNLFLSIFKKVDLDKKQIEKKNAVHFRRDLDSLGQYLEI